MDDAIILRPSFRTICPSTDEVCEIMGYKTGSVPSFIPPLLDELMSEAADIPGAAGCYRIFRVSGKGISDGKVLFDEGMLSCGTKICNQLSSAGSFALFIATAGHSFGEWIKKKSREEDIMAEYLAGSIGSVIAEKVADLLKENISEKVSTEGKGITNSYSPGYCNWNIREQQTIFNLLPAGEIGVSLTESFLMNPVKSISGIIGIGPGLQPGAYICDLCNLTDCLVKRARGL
jgi:hypothetical protein